MSQFSINQRNIKLDKLIFKGHLTKEKYEGLIKNIGLPHKKWNEYVTNTININNNKCYFNIRFNWLLNYYDLEKYIFTFFHKSISLDNLLKQDKNTLKYILFFYCENENDTEIIFNFINVFKRKLKAIKLLKRIVLTFSEDKSKMYIKLNNKNLFILLENQLLSYYDIIHLGISDNIANNILQYIQKYKNETDFTKYSNPYYINNSLFSKPIEQILF